jgi:anti-sigma regulatory factor (Ser/Thr protein kinase)
MSGEIDAPWVRLELASRAEAARLVRSMSSAAGEALGFDPELLSDVNTAVTEACNNVVLHAYGDRPGPMSVELRACPGEVIVRVCDQGSGIRQTLPDHDGLKVGLALMSALADRAEFINVPDGGTEVRLSFRAPAGPAIEERRALERSSDGSSAWQAELHSGLTGDVVLTVSPVALLAPLLGRIGRALAPSAGFSLQRCYNVFHLSDVLGAHAEEAAESTAISVALGARDRRLEFALAPLRVGTSARLEKAASPPRADALAALTEEVVFVADSGHETLRVSMRDHLRA